VEVIGLRKHNGPGNLRARFNLKLNRLTIRGFALMETPTGFWVSLPRTGYQYKGRWIDEPLLGHDDEKWVDLISALARDAYQGAK
jgi:hypothetical protein